MSSLTKDSIANERPDGAAPKDTQTDWRKAFAARVVVTDVIVLIWANFGAAYVVFGSLANMSRTRVYFDGWSVDYVTLPVVIIGAWLAILAAVGSRSHRVIGTGTAEYKTVLQAGLVILVLVTVISFLFISTFSRGFMLLSIPSSIVVILASRWLWRQWLRSQRIRGRFCSRVLLVGSLSSSEQIVSELRRSPASGYWVVGAVTSTLGHGTHLEGTDIPILGEIDQLIEAVSLSQADTVFVTDGHGLSPAQMRALSWSLEPGRQHLVMAPSLTDIAGPRIHARPVAGLPLVHVETPRYEGADRFLKRGFDFVGSGLLLLAMSIPLIIVIIAIVSTSPGGVFFSHERIGKNGHPFRMLKFRSMEADADSRLAGLLAAQGTSEKPLFKIENDPRITKVGGFLRRYSIDEIPQLINVFRGDMSLVGPRPQVAKEVALYDNAAARRLFVKPGMTGLWQVSGRSNLNWEESVRLDLYYVENWSLTSDISILSRTVRAVLASDGAV
jgi:exopolysaccharide biosynthesis polyprenyl glycosylphosphotransferase